MDKLNNAEWQARTLRARVRLRNEQLRQDRAGPTDQVHQLADLLGPDYFTATGFRPDQAPGTADRQATRAAFHAYIAAALALQIAHRRGKRLSLTDAPTHITHITYRTYRDQQGAALQLPADGPV